MTQGFIFNIAHGAVRDGPGWRSVVYFKGCNFSCRWCGAPESIPSGRSVLVYEDGTQEVVGREVTVEEVVREILPYRRFSRNGRPYGVTLTGGEPTCQWAFFVALLTELKRNGFHTAVETNGSSPRLVEALPHLDLVICDVKHMDAKRHRTLVGADNRQVLENVRAVYTSGKPIWVRVPVVPGCNDSPENFAALAEFLARMKDRVKVELLKYARLGLHKWAALGWTYALKYAVPPSDEKLARLTGILRDAGISVIKT